MQKRMLWIGAALSGFLLGCASANAQGGGQVRHQTWETAVPAPPPGERVESHAVFIRNGVPGVPVEFMATEFGVGDKVVKGAPYSADAVTESVQVLADGNRIVHKNSSSMARDSEGRTRRDLSFPALGGVSEDVLPKISVIYDPVANASYTLDHNQKIARKLEGNGMAIHMEHKTPAAGATVAFSAERVASADVVINRAPAVIRMRHSADQGKTESLGSRSIEGVVAEGTRTVQVVPAGEIGNERPIETVSERWYSPELKTVVLTKHIDPRAGETTYKLTNLRRGEPLKSLFEVPADYTVKTDANYTVPDVPVMMKRKIAPKE